MAHDAIIKIIRPRLKEIILQAKLFASLKHKGTIGRLREIAINNLIEPYLPPSVTIVTGTIVSPDKPREYQMQDDVVLFSKEKAPPFVSMLEQYVIPLSGVIAHIEVKSTLTYTDVKKAVLNAIELRDLAEGIAPIGIIFAYTSNLKNYTEVDRLLKTLKEVNFTGVKGQASCPIQMICVADRGTWILLNLPEYGIKSGWYFVQAIKEQHLLAFISIISNHTYMSHGSKGAGEYLLEPSWLTGPSPEYPVLIQ
ncbi:hypothetical protein A3H85_00500 [Candidatus Daviesbacteria bacterium RIFCSPLOWO2_02_FULL_40_8]|nr:MAG: hypothetical protein A2780_03820 [Candidatus Daviesbacteria bacterium RIFCSPHIGHO2_01_FULL_41_45]OGE66038.1 MAG: hypothetical protein A3H85_00500 [Candidatus Daviesbacteria bacterium RIFCSPLOWO2_02_FULL_40_8]OGH81833.1 MAG: hypothetical protein A3F93_03945 [Candidatus Magasanikbacteria bacterium RIFCSPLOWO2_12_FULL_34_7]